VTLQLKTSFQLYSHDLIITTAADPPRKLGTTNENKNGGGTSNSTLLEQNMHMSIENKIPLTNEIPKPENDMTPLKLEEKIATRMNNSSEEGGIRNLNHERISIRETNESNDSFIQDILMTPDNSSNGNNTILTVSNISNNMKKKGRKARAFFGIMTYDSNDERKRRNLIRNTFLSYFVDHMNQTLVSVEEYNEKKHWICSLNDLDLGRLEYPGKCRMAYAFVMGGNPNGTTMLLNFNESYPLSLSPPPKMKSNSHRKDVVDSVYLNIKENGKFGKSPTWFRYAIDVLERHGWMKDWDYIFKSDSDNLIYTPNFFRFMDKLPQKRAVRVFGGRPLDYKGCGGDSHDHCKQMVGPIFMAGGCYFLSLDLAKFISDESTFDHEAVKLPHEDITTGNFVFSHSQKIKIVKEPRVKGVIRTHPVKTDRKFNTRWKKMLREENDRLSSWKASQLLKATVN